MCRYKLVVFESKGILEIVRKQALSMFLIAANGGFHGRYPKVVATVLDMFC